MWVKINLLSLPRWQSLAAWTNASTLGFPIRKSRLAPPKFQPLLRLFQAWHALPQPVPVAKATIVPLPAPPARR